MSRYLALGVIGCSIALVACAGEPTGVAGASTAAEPAPAAVNLLRGPMGVAATPSTANVRRVFFGWDDATLTETAKTELTRVAASRGTADLLVIGHTDTSGPRPYNQRLSEQRAQSVRDFLVSLGVPAHQIEMEAQGQRQPLVRTDDNVRSPLNRRVRIEVGDS